MVKKFVHHRDELNHGFQELRQSLPEVMKGFSKLHREATADGVISAKTKELIALAIGVATQCTGCITLHVHDALKAGATKEEITEAVGVAILMGGGPAAIYGIDALEALEQFRSEQAQADVDASG